MNIITCDEKKGKLSLLEIHKNKFNNTDLTVKIEAREKEEEEKIKRDYKRWIEKIKYSAIILVKKQNAKLINELSNTYESVDGSAMVILPFYVSRYSKSGQKRMVKNIGKRLNVIMSGVFLTLTIDPKQYTLIEAWKSLPDLITRTLNHIKIAKRRDSNKHNKDTKVEYIWVIETQKNGYPHVHVFFANIDYLLPQKEIEIIWGAGFVFIKKIENANIGKYMTKYMTKNQGLSDVLPFVWKFHIRMYGMTQLKTVPKRIKNEEYVMIGSCMLNELEGFSWGHKIKTLEFFGGGGITIDAICDVNTGMIIVNTGMIIVNTRKHLTETKEKAYNVITSKYNVKDSANKVFTR